MRRFALLLPIAVIASAFAPARAAVVKVTDVRFEVSDGVKIAADVYLPDGHVAGLKWPCVVEHTPYRKENRAAEGASLLPGRGIALIELDARGAGGSGGEYDIVFSIREQRDVAEIIEQVATAGIPGVGDVCLDKVGMYGGSYSGIIQYLVATLPPEWYPQHLAAIAPQRAYGDLYRDIVYHGGMVIGSFGLIWSSGTTAYYTEPPLDIATSSDAQAAWMDHLTKNDPMMLNYLANPLSDATFTSDDSTPQWSQKLYADSSALSRIDNLQVPALHLAGWFDAFTRGQMLTFQKALAVEQPGEKNYMVVGPWNHANTHFINPKAREDFHDMLAGWYRHWLAGDTAPAFMSGDRLQYYLMGTGALLDTTGEWRSSNAWPLPETAYTRYYLHGGGSLSTAPPSAADIPSASYVWNPTAGTGEILGRWDNTAGIPAPMPAWDQRTDAPKGLSFTTETLEEPMRVAGPINLHLVATTQGIQGASAPEPPAGLGQLVPPYHDTDFVVKLSDLAPDGTATLITSGYLRASHRAYDPAESEFTLGGDVIRPFHYHDSAPGHVSPPGTGQNLYEIEILPTAKTFAVGHRLQIDIYATDTPNHLTLLKPALNTVYSTPGAESWLLLPLLPA